MPSHLLKCYRILRFILQIVIFYILYLRRIKHEVFVTLNEFNWKLSHNRLPCDLSQFGYEKFKSTVYKTLANKSKYPVSLKNIQKSLEKYIPCFDAVLNSRFIIAGGFVSAIIWNNTIKQEFVSFNDIDCFFFPQLENCTIEIRLESLFQTFQSNNLNLLAYKRSRYNYHVENKRIY